MAYLMAKSLGLDSAELDKILDFVHVCLDAVCGGRAQVTWRLVHLKVGACAASVVQF
jgi:hypothetical protein